MFLFESKVEVISLYDVVDNMTGSINAQSTNSTCKIITVICCLLWGLFSNAIKCL